MLFFLYVLKNITIKIKKLAVFKKRFFFRGYF